MLYIASKYKRDWMLVDCPAKQQQPTKDYRVVKTHRMPDFHGLFPQKSPIISGLISRKRDTN